MGQALLVLALLVLAALARPARAGIIAASSLQMCENRDDGEGGAEQTCEEKMVVSLTLQNMQEESDSIRSIPATSCIPPTVIGEVDTCDEDRALKSGQCCTAGEDQSLTYPLIITAAKSRVRLRYPVTYR